MATDSDKSIGQWLKGVPYLWDPVKKFRFYLLTSDSCAVFGEDGKIMSLHRVREDFFQSRISPFETWSLISSKQRNLFLVWIPNKSRYPMPFSVSKVRIEGEEVSYNFAYQLRGCTHPITEQNTLTFFPSIFGEKVWDEIEAPLCQLKENEIVLHKNLSKIEKQPLQSISDVHHNAKKGSNEWRYKWVFSKKESEQKYYSEIIFAILFKDIEAPVIREQGPICQSIFNIKK